MPAVRATINRYLAAIKPLLPDFQYEQNEQLAEKFLASEAPKLNSLLKARATTHDNWCCDWWLDQMYLRQPLPLPINSSPGMIVHSNHSRSKSENAAFISEIIKLALKYR